MSSTEALQSVTTVPQTRDHSKLPPLKLDAFKPLKDESKYAIRRLQKHRRARESFPMVRRAAVLICLFIGREGDLNVLLSTRAQTLRSYPGDVSLPGGRYEDTDASLEDCARREAFEEIGIPIDHVRIRHLTTLAPFHSRISNLVVTPVVVFLTDLTLQPNLNPAEVDSIFAHPLIGFLQDLPRPPVNRFLPPAIASNKKPYHVQYDLAPHTPKAYRMHQFESSKIPIRGFTADILIHVAIIAYGREPDFDRKAPGQRRRKILVQEAFKKESDFKQAARERTKAGRVSKL